MSIQDSAVLNALHLVIGIDIHDTWPIGAPVPSPTPTPYIWVMFLNGLFMPSVKKGTKTRSDSFPAMQRGTDIGPLTIHNGVPSYLQPFIILGSSSVSEFGAFTVKVENLPVATAFPLKVVTYNLNCQGSAVPPLPLPSGLVAAVPATVFAGMNLGDIIASAACMAADMLVGLALSKLSSFLNSRFILQNITGPLTLRLFANMNNLPLVRAIMLNVPSIVTGAFGFLPSKYADYTPVGLYGTQRDNAAAAIAEYFNPPPGGHMN